MIGRSTSTCAAPLMSIQILIGAAETYGQRRGFGPWGESTTGAAGPAMDSRGRFRMTGTEQGASTAARLGYASRGPSPAMLVAICALVFALTGSAVALKGKNTVKGNDIAPGAVKPTDIDLVKVDGEVGPFITTSGPAVDLGGP